MAPTAWSVLSSFFIFLAGLALAAAISGRLRRPPATGMGLYVWHTIFGLVYAWYVDAFGGDAANYYRHGVEGQTVFGLGSPVITLIVGITTEITHTSFLGVSLVFNIAGSIGLILLYDVLTSITARSGRAGKNLVWLVVLMPSASFWTSGLGKDSLSFLAASLATWAAVEMSRRRVAMAPAIALMCIVRPHVAAVMLAMLLVAALGSPQARLITRLFHGVIVGLAITLLLPIMIAYVGLEDAQGIGDVNSYIEGRRGYNQEGDAGVDISGLPAPLQIATYLYRPLPYEVWSIFALMASVENLLLIGLTCTALHRKLEGGRSELAGRSMFLWLYLLGGSYILASTTANLGIAVRQKWMLMPPLLALLLGGIARGGERRSAPEDGGLAVEPLEVLRPTSLHRAARDLPASYDVRSGRQWNGPRERQHL